LGGGDKGQAHGDRVLEFKPGCKKKRIYPIPGEGQNPSGGDNLYLFRSGNESSSASRSGTTRSNADDGQNDGLEDPLSYNGFLQFSPQQEALRRPKGAGEHHAHSVDYIELLTGAPSTEGGHLVTSKARTDKYDARKHVDYENHNIGEDSPLARFVKGGVKHPDMHKRIRDQEFEGKHQELRHLSRRHGRKDPAIYGGGKDGEANASTAPPGGRTPEKQALVNRRVQNSGLHAGSGPFGGPGSGEGYTVASGLTDGVSGDRFAGHTYEKELAGQGIYRYNRKIAEKAEFLKRCNDRRELDKDGGKGLVADIWASSGADDEHALDHVNVSITNRKRGVSPQQEVAYNQSRLQPRRGSAIKTVPPNQRSLRRVDLEDGNHIFQDRNPVLQHDPFSGRDYVEVLDKLGRDRFTMRDRGDKRGLIDKSDMTVAVVGATTDNNGIVHYGAEEVAELEKRGGLVVGGGVAGQELENRQQERRRSGDGDNSRDIRYQQMPQQQQQGGPQDRRWYAPADYRQDQDSYYEGYTDEYGRSPDDDGGQGYSSGARGRDNRDNGGQGYGGTQPSRQAARPEPPSNRREERRPSDSHPMGPTQNSFTRSLADQLNTVFNKTSDRVDAAQTTPSSPSSKTAGGAKADIRDKMQDRKSTTKPQDTKYHPFNNRHDNMGASYCKKMRIKQGHSNANHFQNLHDIVPPVLLRKGDPGTMAESDSQSNANNSEGLSTGQQKAARIQQVHQDASLDCYSGDVMNPFRGKAKRMELDHLGDAIKAAAMAQREQVLKEQGLTEAEIQAEIVKENQHGSQSAESFGMGIDACGRTSIEEVAAISEGLSLCPVQHSQEYLSRISVPSTDELGVNGGSYHKGQNAYLNRIRAKDQDNEERFSRYMRHASSRKRHDERLRTGEFKADREDPKWLHFREQTVGARDKNRELMKSISLFNLHTSSPYAERITHKGNVSVEGSSLLGSRKKQVPDPKPYGRFWAGTGELRTQSEAPAYDRAGLLRGDCDKYGQPLNQQGGCMPVVPPGPVRRVGAGLESDKPLQNPGPRGKPPKLPGQGGKMCENTRYRSANPITGKITAHPADEEPPQPFNPQKRSQSADPRTWLYGSHEPFFREKDGQQDLGQHDMYATVTRLSFHHSDSSAGQQRASSMQPQQSQQQQSRTPGEQDGRGDSVNRGSSLIAMRKKREEKEEARLGGRDLGKYRSMNQIHQEMPLKNLWGGNGEDGVKYFSLPNNTALRSGGGEVRHTIMKQSMRAQNADETF